jgi:hypothetical protein
MEEKFCCEIIGFTSLWSLLLEVRPVMKNISRISYSTQVRKSLSKNYDYEKQHSILVLLILAVPNVRVEELVLDASI